MTTVLERQQVSVVTAQVMCGIQQVSSAGRYRRMGHTGVCIVLKDAEPPVLCKDEQQILLSSLRRRTMSHTIYKALWLIG